MSTPQPPQPNMGDPGPSNERLSDADWMAQLANDDLAPTLLSAALQLVEPVPAWVQLGAQVAWQTRELDVELISLLSESSTVGASRSVDEDLRILVFGNANKTLAIEVSIRHDVAGPIITGTVTGDGLVIGDRTFIGFSWEGSPPLRQEPVDLDQFGRFEILPQRATRGRIRFDGDSASGATTNPSFVTPWFDI